MSTRSALSSCGASLSPSSMPDPAIERVFLVSRKLNNTWIIPQFSPFAHNGVLVKTEDGAYHLAEHPGPGLDPVRTSISPPTTTRHHSSCTGHAYETFPYGGYEWKKQPLGQAALPGRTLASLQDHIDHPPRGVNYHTLGRNGGTNCQLFADGLRIYLTGQVPHEPRALVRAVRWFVSEA